VEDIFCNFLRAVRKDDRIYNEVIKRTRLEKDQLPLTMHCERKLVELQMYAKHGHKLRIAYNYSSVGEPYSEFVGSAVT
jgi:hypothetical protein